MALLALSFDSPGGGGHCWHGDLTRKQVLALKESFEKITDIDFDSRVINYLTKIVYSDDIADAMKLHYPLQHLFMWWVIWKNGRKEDQEDAGVVDIEVAVTRTTEKGIPGINIAYYTGMRFKLEDMPPEPPSSDRILDGSDIEKIRHALTERGMMNVPEAPQYDQSGDRGGFYPRANEGLKANNFAAEISRYVGPLKGGRIILNALQSRLSGLTMWRPMQIRIDDNDAPGEMTVLELISRQPVAELRPIAELGGILEIRVDHIQPDKGPGTCVVHGTVRVLHRPPKPGGPLKLPPDGWDGIKHSPDLNALVTVVEDSNGKGVWFHALCLDEHGKKVSAEEKRRRLVEATLYKPVQPTQSVTNGSAATPPETPKFALLAQKTLRFLSDPSRLNFWPPELWTVCREHGLAKGWDRRKTLRQLFGSTFASAHARLRESQKIVFDPGFSALICETSQQSPENLLRLMNTARLPFESCWIEWDRTTSPDLHTAPIDSHKVLLGQWGVLLEGVQGESHKFVGLVSYPGDLRVLPVALIVDFRQSMPPADTISFVDDLEKRRRHMLLRSYMERWAGSAGVFDTLVQHGAFTLERTPYGEPMRSIDSAARGKIKALEAYFSQCALFAGSVFRELLVGLALIATHVSGGPLVKELATKTPPGYYHGRFHPAIEYKVLQLARPMTAPSLWRHFRRRAKAERMRWHQVMGHWAHQRAPNALCSSHPFVCPRAVWRPTEPHDSHDEWRRGIDDGGPGDIQACALCARKRWWVRDHARGDLNAGVVEKDYEITASRPRKGGELPFSGA